MRKYIVRDFKIASYNKKDMHQVSRFLDGLLDEDDTYKYVDVCADGYGIKELRHLLIDYINEELHWLALENLTTSDNEIIAFEEWEEDGEVWRVVIATARITDNKIEIEYNKEYQIV